MPVAAMAEDVKTGPEMEADGFTPAAGVEPGAPIPKDQVDPELVRIARNRPKIGMVTAAGVVFLSLFFLWRLNPDRHFAGATAEPTRVTLDDVVAGKIGADTNIVVDADPLMSHAIRASTQKGNLGLRVVPARGTSQKLWLVLPGDGWEKAATKGYVGRLRPLADLPFYDTITSFLASHPRPLFAPAAAVRAAFSTGKVKTVAGDEISVRDTDRIAFDVNDTGAATVTCTFNERHKDISECAKALGDAGVTTSGGPTPGGEQASFPITAENALATTRTKLETAQLWGMEVEPVTKHYETTWGALKTSPPTGFMVGNIVVAGDQLDLIGFYVSRQVPAGALALITGEHPTDYWYVLPVTIVVGLIALLFAWAFVRAVKRDLLPART
jgi:hypothetical protein